MKALISILFLLVANSSFAEDMRYYDVEVIVIENLTKEAKNAENWPLQVNLTRPEKTVELGQPVLSEWLPGGIDLKSSYKLLTAKNFNLSREVKKIAASKKQRIIFHTAWRQPGLDKNLALPIYFKHEVAVPPVIKNKENNQSFAELKAEPISSILEGVLRVTLSRYLHFEAELTFKNKIPELVNSGNRFSILDNEKERSELQKQGVIHLKQNRRRIRSNELHYIDHPVLGILINITQYKKEKKI